MTKGKGMVNKIIKKWSWEGQMELEGKDEIREDKIEEKKSKRKQSMAHKKTSLLVFAANWVINSQLRSSREQANVVH
jgi:hypothetical protein